MVAKKTVKTKKDNLYVEKVIKASDDDLILGKTDKIIKEKVIDYNNELKRYKITNLEINNTPVFFTGNFIDNFTDIKTRKELQKGAKEVIVIKEQKPIYKIEVIE